MCHSPRIAAGPVRVYPALHRPLIGGVRCRRHAKRRDAILHGEIFQACRCRRLLEPQWLQLRLRNGSSPVCYTHSGGHSQHRMSGTRNRIPEFGSLQAWRRRQKHQQHPSSMRRGHPESVSRSSPRSRCHGQLVYPTHHSPERTRVSTGALCASVAMTLSTGTNISSGDESCKTVTCYSLRGLPCFQMLIGHGKIEKTRSRGHTSVIGAT